MGIRGEGRTRTESTRPLHFVNMKQLALLIGLGLLLCSVASPALGQGSFPLEHKIAKGVDDMPMPDLYVSQTLRPCPGKPATLKGKPKDARGELRYFLLTAKDRQVVVAMDGATPSNLYLDTNGDNDLADERPLKRLKLQQTLPSPPSADAYQYGPATLTLLANKDAPGGQILFTASNDNRLTAYPAGYRTGQLEVRNKTYKIVLADANYDGRFEPIKDMVIDVLRRGTEDRMAIDLDGDGGFSYDPPRLIEIMPLIPMLRLGEHYYNVKVAADGSNLELSKASPRMGTLEIKGGDVELTVLGMSGPQWLKGTRCSWELPEGRYRCQNIKLTATDQMKAKWVLQSGGPPGQLQDFQIQAGQTRVIEVGAPLTVKMDMQQIPGDAMLHGKTIGVGFTIVGQAGEQYSPAADKSGKRVPAPKITFYDEQGKVLAQGDFEYG